MDREELKTTKNNYYIRHINNSVIEMVIVSKLDVAMELVSLESQKQLAQSLTPINIMSGFRKWGKFQTFCSKKQSPISDENSSSASVDTHASCAQEAVFQKRYEEGSDLHDICWLQKNHLL